MLGAFALLSSACAVGVQSAGSPEACPKDEAPPDEWAATGGVIPALPPREPLPPAPPGAEYPPPDREPDPPMDGVTMTANAPATDVIGALPAVPGPTTVLLTTSSGHRLLAIDPQARPYRIDVPASRFACASEYVSQLRICVTETGSVANVRILKASIPEIDQTLPMAVSLWRYHPLLVEGRPTPFCYPMNYRVTARNA